MRMRVRQYLAWAMLEVPTDVRSVVVTITQVGLMVCRATGAKETEDMKGEWWGYKRADGKIIVRKAYYDYHLYYTNAINRKDVIVVVKKFEADDRQQAHDIVRREIDEQEKQNHN